MMKYGIGFDFCWELVLCSKFSFIPLVLHITAKQLSISTSIFDAGVVEVVFNSKKSSRF